MVIHYDISTVLSWLWAGKALIDAWQLGKEKITILLPWNHS